MGKKRGVILDGYTLDHTIPETEYHEAVTLKFRPVTKLEYADITDRISKAASPAKGEEIAANVIVNQVKEWDLKAYDPADPDNDEKASPLKISEENAGKLEPHLSASIFNLVMGYEPAMNREQATKN